MWGRNAVDVRTAPTRFVSSIHVQSSPEIFSSLPWSSTPAAFTTTSTCPIDLNESRASERTEESLLTSVESASTASDVPSRSTSSTVRSMRGLSKSAITMFAPCWARALPSARPNPLPPPTMTAVRCEKLPCERGPASGSMDTGRILFTCAAGTRSFADQRLGSLETKGRVVVVDRGERHGLVSGHRGDLAQDVLLHPPRSGQQVGAAPRG